MAARVSPQSICFDTAEPQTLTLHNGTSESLTYSIRSTAPRHYLLTGKGELQPGEEKRVSIALCTQNVPLNGTRDLFRVTLRSAAEDTVLSATIPCEIRAARSVAASASEPEPARPAPAAPVAPAAPAASANRGAQGASVAPAAPHTQEPVSRPAAVARSAQSRSLTAAPYFAASPTVPQVSNLSPAVGVAKEQGPAATAEQSSPTATSLRPLKRPGLARQAVEPPQREVPTFPVTTVLPLLAGALVVWCLERAFTGIEGLHKQHCVEQQPPAAVCVAGPPPQKYLVWAAFLIGMVSMYIFLRERRSRSD